MTQRARHPKSRPLPGPAHEPAFISAASNIVTCAILDAILQGATPQAALLAAARELIHQAQQLQRMMPADGGPRFTRTA